MSGANLGPNLGKARLSTLTYPEEKCESDSSSSQMSKYIQRDIVRNNSTQSMQEMHESRIKTLRKELDYLKETEWKYEPIDKYIGQ